MEIWLYDQNTNERDTLDIKGDSITFGRAAECDVVLKGAFVAKKHARLFRKGNQFFVENLSRSSLRVANRDVLAGQQARCDFADEIQIAQFSIALIRPEGDKSGGRDNAFDLQRKLMDFEQQVHSELVERLNLRVTGQINKADQAYIRQVLAQLQNILDERVAAVPDDLLRHTVHTHLHRLVIAEVVRQCQGRVQTEYRAADEDTLDPNREQAIREIVVSMVDMMPLLFDPTTVSEDLATAEEAYEDLMPQFRESIGRDLRRYIMRQTVTKDIQDIMFGLGPLQDLLEMANVSEIMVVGKDRIYVEKNGVIQPTTRSFFSDEILMSVIERIITPIGRRVDHSTPLVDGRLSDGSRVNIIISPLSLVGPCLTIRKFSWIPFTIDDLIERGSVSAQCAAFLQACVIGRKNLIISGGTGSGKTTLLNTLSAFARSNERIVTIEERAEM